MLSKNLSVFCKRHSKYEQKFAEFSASKNFDELEPAVILEILCEFLMCPANTKDVADCFPELLPALISIAINANDIQSSALISKDLIHRLNCVILGVLIDINQGLLTFVLHYFDINPAPFDFPDTDVSIKSTKRRNIKKCPYVLEVSDYDVVIACYNILKSSVNHFRHKWNWSRFYKYLTNVDDRVKWVALKCIAIVLNMSESTRSFCARQLIRNFDEFLTDHEDKTMDTNVACADFESIERIVKDVPFIVSAGGILLSTYITSNQTTHALVQVPSTRRNLQSLAIAVDSRKCICLQGPVGCGKTALVEYLARLTGHDGTNFVKVQLGDQTDSKMLLGMYRCTDVPGEFIWQPGVLTQAVVAGKWLLLEDIDNASQDVASVLSSLMETGTLCVPGYRDTIHTNSGFQLFVTQRLTAGAQKYSTGSSNLLQKYWLCLNVEALSKDELVVVIQTLFPVLSTIATRMVDVFLLFSVGNHDNDSTCNDGILSLKIGRQTSTRDLIKWCYRAIIDFDVSSSDSALKIFQDALDVFCCSVTNQEQRLNLAIAVAHKLGIIKTKAEYFCNVHKPSITLLPEALIAGRAKLFRKKAKYAKLEIDRTNFSFTRPSACLLERVASCVMQKEPVLLVGETGTGKTSSVQYLARSTGHKLTIINMNQQSESADLLGGYKPVDLKFLISPIREEFECLFRSYFEIEPNRKYLEHIGVCHNQQKWKSLVAMMSQSARAAVKRLTKTNVDNDRSNVGMLRKWESMLEKLNKLSAQVKSQYALAFSFVEGSLVRALRDGYWVLLDEINLANAETLECLSGLLEGSSESLPLLERGDGEPVKRHPDFTVFACMNPATDVGKKNLPVGLRNRFTEFYIDELIERSDLQLLVSSYLKELNLSAEKHEAIVKFYLNVRKKATNTLFDGTAHKPHYSLRTLCRALHISASNPCNNVLRSLYEAFSLSFLTQLDYNSYPIVNSMISKAILDSKNVKAILSAPIPKPMKCCASEKYVNIEGYWLLQGNLTPETPNNYILTNSVRRNLKDLVRVASIGKLPILLQGDTSVGKTSLITYLAKISGHVCVRINNHEHTDLQEYVGSYIADENGKLIFKEGILVDAMRKGYWIILDELNLAPSDVLEALNRVLDDNRELFIPETQQVVKAHERFMLFATQNPPGLYGGRKVLSRAFRNRFVELHFDEIPADELQIILNQRCSMPESYCKQVINVMKDLQIRRKSTAAFAGKKGFITLRDLFRWGERYRLAPDVGNKLYDWSQHLADEGYLVLAAKVRKSEEADEIRQVIKKHLKRDVNPDSLFTLNDKTSPVTKHILEKLLDNNVPDFDHIVWTYHMCRMAVLVIKSCQFKEPVLLVGETGGGKTTVCQLIAAINGQTMRAVNCHMHTESSDFLGNLRPVREHSENDQRLFEWMDGPLVNAMRNGDLFLADEISLADDSVLERLNSLLEPERSLLLAEKGIESSHGEETTVIIADEKFVFVGTMNPGGDYGKKELSPALRNRFTEIWCEGCTARSDLRDIIVHNLCVELQTTKESVASAILRFTEWLHTTEVGKKLAVSIRDVLTWVKFINTSVCDARSLSTMTIGDAYYHGACLTYIDSLGSGCTGSESVSKLKDFANAAVKFIKSEIKQTIKSELNAETFSVNEEAIFDNSRIFGIPPFYIEKGSRVSREDCAFTFMTPTTKLNTLKLLRALQLNKPILLEGSPGIGKTSLVSALAKAAGHNLLRINLSDQTDVSDLFGADLPVEGGKGGEFAWRDGPFLRALRAGYWILLDELNLASQSVLEGLNACFDHRGEIYIPELGKTFSVKPGTRLFACQNPLRQGGARRGLPKSFLNRFTQVFVDALMEDDLKFILAMQFPQLPASLIHHMVQFNGRLASEVGVVWGHAGSPWEMNLRDITRWCEITIESTHNKLHDDKDCFNIGNGVELIYMNRMRTKEDRQKVHQIYQEIFSIEKYPLPPSQLPVHITMDKLFIGDVMLNRTNCNTYEEDNLLLLRDQKATLKSLMQCVKMNWMSILVGASGCGKSNVVRLLAALTGQKLKSIGVNSAMDTTEILGGFEQTDYNRHLEQLFERVSSLLIDSLQTRITIDKLEQVAELHGRLEQVRRLFNENVAGRTMAAETKLFLRKVEELSKLVSTVKSWEPGREPELRDIESKLRGLSIFVEEDKCLNAGGKFEWVDSVLVKCLQNGTWLLIDQVNLCSPAVLDRLNGLLEPNGVLTIGERGVDNDGNIVTIKPHENFRLFLTMDTRYGEISRAMRNRGVEIYMLGPKEKIDYDAIDLRSLLFNAGIARLSHRDTLHEIYDKMSREIVPVEHLNVVDLLHTAFLVKQRSLRGFTATQSIRDACIDVYIRARPAGDPRFKEYLIGLIDEVIERHSGDNNEISPVDLDAATWSMRNLHDNSALTIIRQQGLLLNAAVKIYRSCLTFRAQSTDRNAFTTRLLNNFCSLEEGEEFVLNVDIGNILPYFLLNFYEQSSRDDVGLRKEWISKILSENGTLDELEKRSALMAREITSFGFRSADADSFLPWDQRRLAGKAISGDNVAHDSATKLALLLYACSAILKSDKTLTDVEILKDKNVISVKKYSTIVNNGLLLSQLKNQPLITHYVSLLERARSCVFAILHDSNVSVSPEDYVELRKQLRWYARFEKLGEMMLINKSEKSENTNLVERVSSLLSVHYKWLLKFLRKLCATYGQLALCEKTVNEIKALSEITDYLNDQLDPVYDPVKKISKRIKKHLALPSPHSSDTGIRIHTELRRITKDLDARDEQVNILKQKLKIAYVQLRDALAMRHQAISQWSDVYSGKPANESTLETAVLTIKRFCDDSHIRLRTPAEIANALTRVNSLPREELARLNRSAQLWPIYEYVFLSFACALQGKICTRETTTSAIECLANFADAPSIPNDLLGLLNAITHTEIVEKHKILLLPQLFYQFTRFARQSCTIRDSSSLLLNWHDITEDDIETLMTTYVESKTDCYLDGSVLPSLMLRLMLDKADDEKERNVFPAIMLGTYATQTDHLQLLNEILWRNSVSLASERYNFATQDLATLRFYLHLYLSAIDRMNSEHDVRDLIAAALRKQGGGHAIDIERKLQTEYFEPVEKLRRAYDGINSAENKENVDENENALRRGRAWMLLGHVQLLLFANLDLIDPVHKVELKLKYLEEDILDCERTVYVETLQNRVLGLSMEKEHVHPRFAATKNCEKYLWKARNDLDCQKAFRPSTVSFVSLSKDCNNFKNGVGSYKLIERHMNELSTNASEIINLSKLNYCRSSTSKKNVTQEAEMWCLSIQRFAEQLEAKYLSGYPDLVLPLLTALAQLTHGVRILINEIRLLTSRYKYFTCSTISSNCKLINSDLLVYNLIRFPTIGPQQESLLHLSSLCISKTTLTLTDRFTMQEKLQCFKWGLHELQNHVILNRVLTKSVWQEMNALLERIYFIWNDQQRKEKENAAERENLYKYKSESHSNTTEEEQFAQEVCEFFPTYREEDFHDIEDNSERNLDKKKASRNAKDSTAESSGNNIVTKDDTREIQQIHSNIVTLFVASKWLYGNSSCSTAISTNYIKPLIQRYDMIYNMLGVLSTLNEALVNKLYNSLNLLVSLRLQSSGDKNVVEQSLCGNSDGQRTKTYDFYKSSNVEEVKQCLPLCESILSRVDQLLEEWPAHPTLKSIRCIIERIYTFPITSAVSRFLTGLELLLVKMHQWEENAHSGVSMADYVSTLTQQIISWRKLELSCWRGCLDATYDNLRSESSKWWFFLYMLIESYAATRYEEKDDDIKQLAQTLERFVNESSLVEFESRLELLLTFHCHVYYCNGYYNKRDELLAVLWNLYNYYKQFIPDVNKKIDASRAPIEKKLKDFVKIARWNDINYWSVKETVQKTHRTLYKFVKEFQNSLKQNVSACLTVKSNNSYSAEISKDIWDNRNHRTHSINPTYFMVTNSPRFVKVKTPQSSGLIAKIKTFAKIAMLVCQKIILVSSYMCARGDIEIFVENFLERSARLRDMEINKSMPKSKQKSQAKSILQQKKMTLANYFTKLTQLGVSYRIGMLTSKNNADKLMDFTVSPLDLSVISKYFKLTEADEQMLTQWQGCERYYYKSLIRLNSLEAMFTRKENNLLLQTAERCYGYSAHMMLMAHRQKTTLARSFDCFSLLRVLVTNLSEVNCEEDLNTSRQLNGQDCAWRLKTLLITLEAGFEQLLLFLRCCPAAESPTNRAVLTLDANALSIVTASQDSEIWKNANGLLQDGLGMIKITAKRFHALFTPFEVLMNNGTWARTCFLSSKHLEFLEQCCGTIADLRTRSEKLKQLFESSDVVHPIVENIVFLESKMKQFLDDFENSRVSETENKEQLKRTDENAKAIELRLECLVNTILLIIQKKFKQGRSEYDNFFANEMSTEEKEKNDNDVEENIDKNKLKMLVETLEKDITELKLFDVAELFASLVESIQNLDLQSANYCTRLIVKCLPLLQQYVLLAQFYLNEQVASFRLMCKILYLQLNVFLDLAENGFCVPKNLDQEESEKDDFGQKTDKGGMGLADGEGTKDVSDRIESEDQLEDAKPADQEQEKQEDKACEEEEKGIDMSGDFDGMLHDMDKYDDDEEQNDSDEENDLDKEMGETREGAEQLDKEIWAGDEEDSDEIDQENEEEGTGEQQIGEKEMGAKDDRDKRKQQNDDECEESRDQEKERSEINELKEPEIDEDQIDPYHGKQQPEPEAEPLDLPEDLNLDEDAKEENGGEEENPFDIDEMKTSKPPPEVEHNEEDEKKENEKDNSGENTDEDEDGENMDKETEHQASEEREADIETAEKSGADLAEAENKDKEQNQEEEEKAEEDKLQKAAPSADDASKQADAAQQVEEIKEGSRDAVAQKPDGEEQQNASTENTQEGKDDKGTGQSQSVQQESGHSGSSEQETVPIPQKNTTIKPIKKRNNPGKSDEDRSLLDKFEPMLKKPKITYTQNEMSNICNEKENELGDTNGDEAEMCQHIKDSEKFDDYTMDAATEDQIKQQIFNEKNREEENRDEKIDNVEMHQDEENIANDKVKEQNPEKVSQIADDKHKKDSDGGQNIGESQVETTVELDGETVETVKVSRGNESTFHTALVNLEESDLSSNQKERTRFEVERMLGEWTQMPSTEEAAAAWNCLCSVTDAAARDLSEKLRLVLEPTQASRLKGDYKTGKRINMRKIIPYIASQFRKDKIWLRRTKPSKRDYQIVLALDDSSSMADNHSKELAFESLSLISKAMTYLEVGQLGVISFGQQVKLLHPLAEPFTEQSGSRLMQEMKFDQKKTMIGQLVDFTVDMFENQHVSSDNAKLLVVLSDGRGIFSEGIEKVNYAVRRARLVDIFLVFIIVDNPINKDSILDIRMPVFEGGKLLGIRSYMDNFPFPFYMILRDINMLPGVLSDALRQWFEVIGKTDT